MTQDKWISVDEQLRKPVVGWEGLYEVDGSGSVWSVNRTVFRSDGTIQRFRMRQMKPMISDSGYLVVRLSRPGKRTMARVHRLVAMSFLPNPENLPEVNHIDGNRANPSVNNLEWCTPSGNRWHAYHILGSIQMPKTGKLSFEKAQEIRRLYIPGQYGYKRLAKRFGVDHTSIRSIINNKYYAPPPGDHP